MTNDGVLQFPTNLTRVRFVSRHQDVIYTIWSSVVSTFRDNIGSACYVKASFGQRYDALMAFLDYKLGPFKRL